VVDPRAVEQMDLSEFYGAYRENGQGRAAYEPSMMVALLLYAYARGNRSSRGIERACREDVTYKVITAMQVIAGRLPGCGGGPRSCPRRLGLRARNDQPRAQRPLPARR
jgi:transposase